MKYKIGDFVKTINPARYSGSPVYNTVKDRICIIIEYDVNLGYAHIFNYKVKYIDGKKNPNEKIDYCYDHQELIRISREDAVLEIL